MMIMLKQRIVSLSFIDQRKTEKLGSRRVKWMKSADEALAPITESTNKSLNEELKTRSTLPEGGLLL